MGLAWNPYAELALRPHVALSDGEVPGGGVIFDYGDIREIVLDIGLGWRERAAVLTHELIHEERGIFFNRSTPIDQRRKEEEIVRRLTTNRLIPPHSLRRFLLEHGEGVTAGEVAEEFETTLPIASHALALLERRATTEQREYREVG